MECLHITLRPLSAFGGAIKGDTLFGQLCWAVRNRQGEDALRRLLKGYTQGRPFAVCSDAFPAGYVPRPALPLHYFDQLAQEDRKAVKRRKWLPRSALSESIRTWLGQCHSESQVLESLGAGGSELTRTHAQPHNSINRLSGTTGGSDFAPYTQTQHWFGVELRLECWILVDAERLVANDLRTLFEDIGRCGYGRDASIGLGKFAVEQAETDTLPRQDGANACFTLAPCAPQGLGFDPARSHYEVFTRFGRHGDTAVQSGRPFKAPVLLAQTGALLVPPALPQHAYAGQGLGGDGTLSNAIPETVQQGYAPYIGVRLREDT
ncbi:MAG: CRISPR-associated protein Csm7 [Pseudomonadota bacterium]|nr:CRISPR-associated protein Csm7 [Pseudomonadota bacterium]